MRKTLEYIEYLASEGHVIAINCVKEINNMISNGEFDVKQSEKYLMFTEKI